MPNRIKELRERLSLTQRQFASRIGVGLSTVTHWEQGKSYPNSIYRKRLCTVQEYAGHRKIETTMNYVHLSNEHKRKAIEKLAYSGEG